MNSNLARIVTTVALAVLPLGLAGSARGCGLDWALPRNHFEGVTNQGNVSYWEKIGEVDCGDGLVLPLHINFNSHRDGGAPSPYLGQGWLLALLESKFVQESEDRFNMIQPDGLNNLFLRAEKGGSVLNGSSGWKAEIAGDTINAWASCGWKLTFTNGRITSMTTAKGRRLDWVYEGGKVSELREASATRLKIEYGTNGRMQALVLPGMGERILVAQDQKPRVQSVAGQNAIAGVDESLSRLTFTDGGEQSFRFGTDDKLRPTLEVGDVGGGSGQATGDAAKKQISWDPQSKLIVQDGAWTYQITPAKGTGENAAIGRTNAQKQREYWLYDAKSGKETVGKIDGVTETRTWFTSGKLSGKTKKIEQSENGKIAEVFHVAYDENGRVSRLTQDGLTWRFKYDVAGKLASYIKDPENIEVVVNRSTH